MYRVRASLKDNDWTSLRQKYFNPIAPLFFLLSLSCIGGVILYEAESAYGDPENDPFVNNTAYCIKNGGYWSSILFVNGICTAIGIGSKTPCSGWGRGLTVCFTLLGVPLALVLLTQVGGVMSRFSGYCYMKLHQFFLARKINLGKVLKFGRKQTESDGVTINLANPLVSKDTPINLTPLWFIVMICVSWIMLCGLVFALKCDWNFGSGAFFSFSLLTIGALTDVTHHGYDISLFTIVTSFIGLSLLSNLINTIQTNIEKTVIKTRQVLKEEIKESIANHTPVHHIDDILASLNTPSYITKLIPKITMDNLQEQRTIGCGQICASTQTLVENVEQLPPQVVPAPNAGSVAEKVVTAAAPAPIPAEEDRGVQVDIGPETLDQECMAQPTTRTVKLQFPKPRVWQRFH